MTLGEHFTRAGRGMAIGAATLVAVGLTTVPRPADALSPAAGVGIGLGAFAAGTALGAAANPYYNPYNSYYSPYGYSYAPAYGYSYAPAYGYSYAPAQAYYPSTPYYPQRSCWDAYYRRSYAC
jgi:hypothetical protein